MVDAEVHYIDRGAIACDRNCLIEGHVVATRDEPNPDLEYGEIPVWNLVIDHPEATILWDTGSHHAAADRWPAELAAVFDPVDAAAHRLDDDLEAAGYGIDDIDAVVQSHLHVDHAGGLEFFAGSDVPIFVHEAELRYAYYSTAVAGGDGGQASHGGENADDGYRQADFDHDLRWHVLHDDREEHFTDLTFVRLPGHTPGLVGAVLHLDGEGTIVIAGDQLCMERNYVDGIPPGGPLLWNNVAWYGSLRRVRALQRRHDAEIVYGHDPDRHESLLARWGQ